MHAQEARLALRMHSHCRHQLRIHWIDANPACALQLMWSPSVAASVAPGVSAASVSSGGQSALVVGVSLCGHSPQHHDGSPIKALVRLPAWLICTCWPVFLAFPACPARAPSRPPSPRHPPVQLSGSSAGFYCPLTGPSCACLALPHPAASWPAQDLQPFMEGGNRSVGAAWEYCRQAGRAVRGTLC